MTRKDEIDRLIEQEADSLKLARKYLRIKDYFHASEYYRRAAFHKAVRESLEKR